MSFKAAILSRRVYHPLRLFTTSVQDKPKALHITKYPGSRVLELSRPNEGNLITNNLIEFIKNRVSLYAGNHTIGAIIFSSESQDIFSLGLEIKQLSEKESRKQLLQSANELAHNISQLKVATVAVFGGEVDSTAFGVFGSARFRLGTQTTKFQVRDLLQGRLPLGGALASQLSKTSKYGYAVRIYSLNDHINVLILNYSRWLVTWPSAEGLLPLMICLCLAYLRILLMMMHRKCLLMH